MPELPEVEVTRRRLEPRWVGHTIERVTVGPKSYFFVTPPSTLKRRLQGRTTTALSRHGKYLVAQLDDGSRLLCHLGMTGQLFATEEPSATDPHVHLALSFASGRLVFRDVRKFGKVEWIAPGGTSARLEKLGPDALAITPDELHARLRKRRIPIKTALLDQAVLAGVGNIYADEALFRASIRPTRVAARLSRAACVTLCEAIRAVMRSAIRAGGSTIADFRHPDGGSGAYQQNHLVYGKGGAPCPACGAELRRIVLSQRSTHFCVRCQK